jgi:adenylate kinase family enzyme
MVNEMARVHILGASGSGTSTLGVSLARHLACSHVDADSLFWMPTDPPFTTPRPSEERQTLLLSLLPANGQWIFSGSATGWAIALEPFFDLVVFLTLDRSQRIERLRRREYQRYGSRVDSGGDMADASAAFLSWANAYDTAGLEQRSLATHNAWLGTQRAPVLRLESSTPVQGLIVAILAQLKGIGRVGDKGDV